MRERWVYNSGKNRIKGSCPDNWEHYNFNNERWECGKDRKINMKTRGRKYIKSDSLLKKKYEKVLNKTGGHNG